VSLRGLGEAMSTRRTFVPVVVAAAPVVIEVEDPAAARGVAGSPQRSPEQSPAGGGGGGNNGGGGDRASGSHRRGASPGSGAASGLGAVAEPLPPVGGIEATRLRDKLLVGGWFKKHGRRGFAKKREVWIDASFNYILWAKHGARRKIERATSS
jgi:hypothetical protein